MRIAFASCAFNRVFQQQPVWGRIAQQQPDHLVLLGDIFYLDVLGPNAPQLMTDDEFAQHLFALHVELIAQPDFAALVGAMPPGTVHAIWDDHDFLWNDAMGIADQPAHREKLRLTTAFREALRIALAQQLAPGSFPAFYNDARFWDPAQPELGTPSLPLAADLMLHLSDGRSHRTGTWGVRESRRTLFGQTQRDRFEQAITAAPPQALHLWASGSTIAGYQRYPRDLDWLEGVAANHRTLVLSGDIHRNRLDAFYTGGLPLHEATSSGAAVRDAVVVGAERSNFGMLEIDAQTVTIRLFKRSHVEMRRVLDRVSWLPL
jgi:alkaline phosphatase D